jgi:alkylated DNA repair dioxygenase AlkB
LELIYTFSAIELQPNGLYYKKDYLTQELHDELFYKLQNNFNWDNQPQRREVKQYGQIYNYRKQKFEDVYEKIPDWLRVLTNNLVRDHYFMQEPNQIIINKYRQTGNRNWSIPPHIDSAELFGDRIASISLGNSCVVEFCRAHHDYSSHKLTVEPRSLYIMTKDSRYEYYHRIPDKKYNKEIEIHSQDNVRISLTFRNVL